MARPPGHGSGWAGSNVAWSVLGTLLAGPLVWGGIGYLVDRLIGTEPLLLVIGILVGAAGAFYLVYVKYGRGDGEDHAA
jgi:F0F1-type ATP synthase assembly protein I